MKIYMAGCSDYVKREIIWKKIIRQRLFSYYMLVERPAELKGFALYKEKSK